MKVYFIGSAGLLTKCAALAEEKYGSNAEVIVFDVKKSGLTKAEIFEVFISLLTPLGTQRFNARRPSAKSAQTGIAKWPLPPCRTALSLVSHPALF